VVSVATNGTASPNVDGTVSYTPNAGYTGLDSFTYTVQDDLAANSNVATVTVSVTLGLPFSEDFTGNLDNWTVVNDTPDLSDWQILSGELNQLASASATLHGDDTYLRGSYIYLNTALDLSNYRMSFDLIPTAIAEPRKGDDIGVLFRYTNNNNYYRLSINSKFGYTRLEKRVSGIFSTLALNTRGYRDAQLINVSVEVTGNLIKVFIDGVPIFGEQDNSLSTGTIALYSQSQSKFDNIALATPGASPEIVINRPLAFSVVNTNDIIASAIATNVPIGGTVRFEIDSAPCSVATEPVSGFFSSSCPTVSQGEHLIEAILEDSLSVELSRDSNDAVGSLGNKLLAIGDSITNGVGDLFLFDNISNDIVRLATPIGPRIISFRGYESNLHNLLTENSLYSSPNTVFNEGISLDTSSDTATRRIDSILERHSNATVQDYLILLGTNDSNQSLITPSGLGCTDQTSCAGTYKGNMQDLIDSICPATSCLPGEDIYIASVPPRWGVTVSSTPFTNPTTTSQNILILDYNTVISSELTKINQGPDFNSYFLGSSFSRLSLFDDNLHPNSLGYAAMAKLWDNSQSGDTIAPFILNSLCIRTVSIACDLPILYKQNYVTAGDSYYIDRAYSVTTIPAVLNGGIWIKTALADKANSRDDYISFTVDRDVDVYIAYFPGATTLPTWLTTFTDTGLEIVVTAGTPTLHLYKQTFSSGSNIILGGNIAAGVSGAINNNYIVIVKEL